MDKRIAELEGKVKTLNLRLKKTGDVLKKDDRAAFERHKVSVEALVRQNFGTAPYYIRIQFLNRENNNKNNTLPLRKQICLTTVWRCAEISPPGDYSSQLKGIH